MIIPVMHTCILFILYISCSLCAEDIDREVLEEGHLIRKRFAEFGYYGYDTASTSRDLGEGRFRRSVEGGITEPLQDGGQRSILLNMTGGKSLRITLRHAPIFDDDLEIVHNTEEGRIRKKTGLAANCIASGEVEGGGIASFSLCDGLFGMLFHEGFDYLVHPIESIARSKRDVNGLRDSKVHIIWRRSVDDSLSIADTVPAEDVQLSPGATGTVVRSKNMVIELALFSDAKFCQQIEQLYPGRQDEFLLSRIAASQVLYSDPDKVGYDVKIKVKLLEYWNVDPKEYHFQESLGPNLNSFCRYTKTRYFYDVHGLHSGITHQKGPAIGMAYGSGACKSTRCYVTYPKGINSFNSVAHEIGHTLGLKHPSESRCPAGLDRRGFMGGKLFSFNFSPCNKWELDRYLRSSLSRCLFTETGKSGTPTSYQNLPYAFPGQLKSPDELCQLYAGSGYVYYPPGPTTGIEVCRHWFCINNNEKSWEYGRMKAPTMPKGFPCGKDMFCRKERICLPLDSPDVGFNLKKLKADEGISNWSDWSTQWTPCSRPCGTGVQIRRRQCRKNGVNLKPYCEGEELKARLCNEKPCAGHASKTEQRILLDSANAVCKRFVDNDSHVAASFLPRGVVMRMNKDLEKVRSRSCMVRCGRSDGSLKRNIPDAILPDGAICLDPPTGVKRSGTVLRCVQGRCMEFSSP